MEMNYTFNFDNIVEMNKFALPNNIIVHIDKIDDLFASLYFSDLLNKRVKIPSEIDIFFINKNKKTIHLPIDKKYYILCWGKDYEIDYNKELKINFTTKHISEITVR